MTGRELLAAWIDRSKFTQRQAAGFIGITEGKLSLYLSGRARPGVDVVLRIEDATGVPARSWTLSGLSKTKKRRPATGDSDAVLSGRKA
jgi:transcriptional regulator with XRE-family HTH domain